MRLLIAQFSHETNGYSPVRTDLARFCPDGRTLLRGAAATVFYTGTNTCMGGFLEVAAECGAEVVIPVAASAFPSGIVEDAAFDTIAARIVEEVARGGFDGILLELHGAMVTRRHPDGEGELLRRIRAVDPLIPIGIALDMHANVFPAMAGQAGVIAGYRTYPHVDMAETARRAARVLLRQIRGEIRPVCHVERVPMIPHVMRQGTHQAPNRDLQAAAAQIEDSGAALLASVFVGFPYADVSEAAASVIVVTDGAADHARAQAGRLAAQLWQARQAFVFDSTPLDAALSRARDLEGPEGPVILLDHHDNCASGGTMDTTAVLAGMIRHGISDAVFFGICDPEALAQMFAAGRGASVELALGGKVALTALGIENPPLPLRGRVAALLDDLPASPEMRARGVHRNLGAMGVLDIGGIEIVVSASQIEPISLDMLTPLGISAADKRFVALKSRVHWRTAFGAMARAVVECSGIGVCTSDYRQLPLRNLRRPLFPLDSFEVVPGRSRSVDHVVWVVPDLTALGHDMERLGFQIMPIMLHDRIGTSNRIIQLHDNYLEFIGDAQRAPAFLADRLVLRLAWERGLAMVSLTSDDLAGDHAALLASGIETNPILNATRAVTMPDGSKDATRSSSFYSWNPAGDSLSLFRSQHGRPETIWIPAYQQHPNGAQTLCGLVYVARDPLASAGYFERMFEAPVQIAGAALSLTTPRGERVEVITPAAAARRFGANAIALDPGDAGCCLAVCIRVADLGTLAEMLHSRQVVFERSATMITVAPGRTAGVIFQFMA